MHTYTISLHTPSSGAAPAPVRSGSLGGSHFSELSVALGPVCARQPPRPQGLSRPASRRSPALTADLDPLDEHRLAGVQVHADRLPVQHVQALLQQHGDVLPLALLGERRPGAVLQPDQLLALVVLRLSAAYNNQSGITVAWRGVVNGGI